MLKVKPTGLADRLDVRSETGVKDDPGPQGAWMELPLTKVSRTETGLVGGQQTGHLPPPVSRWVGQD